MFPHLLDLPEFGVIDNKVITSVTIKSTLVKIQTYLETQYTYRYLIF